MSQTDTDARFDFFEALRRLGPPTGPNQVLATKNQEGLELEWRDASNASLLTTGTIPTEVLPGEIADAITADSTWQEAVAAVAISQVALDGGLGTIDDYTLANFDRVLLTAQSEITENGIYIAADVGVWERASDLVGSASGAFNGKVVSVKNGTLYAGSLWRLTGNVGAAINALSIANPSTTEKLARRMEILDSAGVRAADFEARALYGSAASIAFDWSGTAPLLLVLAADPDDPVEGMIYYNSTTHKLKVRVAAAWETLTSL